MHPRKIFIASLIVSLFALSAAADEIDVSGVWILTIERPSGPGGPGEPPEGRQRPEDQPPPPEEGEQSGRRGPGPQTITIVQEGNRLTVTSEGPRGTVTGEGGLDDGTISWTWTINGPRGEMSMTFTGTVEGDKMSGTVEMGRGRANWSAERAEETSS